MWRTVPVFFFSFLWQCSLAWLSSAYFIKKIAPNHFLPAEICHCKIRVRVYCLLPESSFLIPLMMGVCRYISPQPVHWDFAKIQVAQLYFRAHLAPQSWGPKGCFYLFCIDRVLLTWMGSFLWGCSGKEVVWDWKTGISCSLLLSLFPVVKYFDLFYSPKGSILTVMKPWVRRVI